MQQNHVGGGAPVTAQKVTAASAHASMAGPAADVPSGGARATVAGLYGLSVCLASSAAVAQGIPLVRDAETENLLKDYSRPIFRAASLGSHITMRIVKHESFNAFVIDGLNVFINTGTLLQAKTPNEVIGVIAHETGHITGGHMAALRTRIARDQTKALLLMVLGIGAMVGSAASGGGSDAGSAGMGVGLLGQEMVMRSFLSERRSQESAADQAGLRFLEATQQSGRGMLETFEGFAQQEYVSSDYQDPFVRSHPVAADRIARLRELVAKSPYVDKKDPPELQLRHDLVRAKISGYLESTQTVFNRYPAKDTQLARPLRPRHRAQLLGPLRPGHRRGGGPHPREPGEPLFLGDQGQLPLLGRQAPRGDCAAAQGPAAGGRQRAADAGAAGPGAAGDGGQVDPGGSDRPPEARRGGRPVARDRVQPAGHRPCEEGRRLSASGRDRDRPGPLRGRQHQGGAAVSPNGRLPSFHPARRIGFAPTTSSSTSSPASKSR